MKIVVFGSRGYLGEQFRILYPEAVCPSVDIADATAVAQVLDDEKPDVVINAAGKTGRPNIDWCETHKIETVRSNVTGPLVLLQECSKRGIYWVHLGSGCIYEGDNGGGGFTEDDAPNFFGSFYSRTKASIDGLLKEFSDEGAGVLVLRLRMPFDASDSSRNLLIKLVKYPKVLDVKNSLTYLPDFLDAAMTLIERRKTGIYNVVNPGAISPYEVMQKYKNIVDEKHVFERLTLDGLPSVVKAGRSNCILSTEKLAKEGITLGPVEEAVADALTRLATLRGVGTKKLLKV